MMVELFTNQYPTNNRESWEMDYFKTDPWPSSRRQLSREVLTIVHFSGATLFHCPRPCARGGVGSDPVLPLYM